MDRAERIIAAMGHEQAGPEMFPSSFTQTETNSVSLPVKLEAQKFQGPALSQVHRVSVV